MLNRKGQSLVLFVLLLPIMLGIMAFVIDVGNAIYVKNDINNAILMVMDVALDKQMQQEDIEVLLHYNLEENQNIVVVRDDVVVIESKTHVKGIFSKLFGFEGFLIDSEYEGSIRDGKKVTNKKK